MLNSHHITNRITKHSVFLNTPVDKTLNCNWKLFPLRSADVLLLLAQVEVFRHSNFNIPTDYVGCTQVCNVLTNDKKTQDMGLGVFYTNTLQGKF